MLLVSTARGRKRGTARATKGSPYLAAFQHLERLGREAPVVPVAPGWRPLGPYSIPHGQTYGSGAGSRPAVAGRISTVAIDPSNPNHLLIGAAGGGVWESFDDGLSWTPRTDNQPALAMGAVAFDPTNPSVAYAGTGEGDAFWWLGVGLLRSLDGGTTWNLLASTPFAGRGFYDLVVDPLDGNHLLAATTAGLYESTNGGTTWAQRRTQKTWDLSMHPAVAGDPNSTDEVFAACSDGLFRSTDGGSTWSSVALPSAPATPARLEVCHAPSDGSAAYVFGASNTSGFLWRRGTFGGGFSAETLPPGLDVGQAWYDWFAAAAPNNADVLYVGAIDVHKGVRSSTGTWTWSKISARSSGDSIHPDQHAIAFGSNDPNVVYIGNDGGLYRSSDGGTTWQSRNKGLCITEFEYLAQHPQYEAWLLGGTQDNGTERYEGQEVWFHAQDGDGGDCGCNAASPYTCYHTFYGMGMERSTTGGGWGSWAWVGPNPPAGHNALFYPPLEVSGNVVAQAGQSVYISTDGGTSWTSVALPAGAGVATALAIPTATQILVGTSTGRVYQIASVGGTWGAAAALTQPRIGFISDVLVDPTNASRLWTTYSTLAGSHVFRSNDGGTTWTDVSAGLPAIPVNAIVLDPANTNIVYVGADVGVYRSPDAGATWAAFSNLLPNAIVNDLVFHSGTRLLRAATQSRGVWEIAVDAATMPDVDVYLRDSVVDTGRVFPSPSGVADPFSFGSTTHWWQCTDVKVDSPSFQQPLLTDVDFEIFEDDHGVFAAGLLHESAQRNRTVRVYVQTHNRGPTPATNVAVKVFFADASLGLPDLPSGFWAGFPNNVLPATSPWQPIAAHKTVPVLTADRAVVVGFEWLVPPTAANHSCLLVVLSAANDPVTTTTLAIGTLVRGEKKCGLKNLAVIDPPAAIGPRLEGLHLNLWGTRGTRRRYRFGVDRPAGHPIHGIVLSKRLSKLALSPGRAAATTLKRSKPTADESAQIEKLVKGSTPLRRKLDLTSVYRPGKRAEWLSGFELDGDQPEPILVLVSTRAKPGHYSLLQWADDGVIAGGFTLQLRGQAARSPER